MTVANDWAHCWPAFRRVCHKSWTVNRTLSRYISLLLKQQTMKNLQEHDAQAKQSLQKATNSLVSTYWLLHWKCVLNGKGSKTFMYSPYATWSIAVVGIILINEMQEAVLWSRTKFSGMQKIHFSVGSGSWLFQQRADTDLNRMITRKVQMQMQMRKVIIINLPIVRRFIQYDNRWRWHFDGRFTILHIDWPNLFSVSRFSWNLHSCYYTSTLFSRFSYFPLKSN